MIQINMFFKIHCDKLYLLINQIPLFKPAHIRKTGILTASIIITLSRNPNPMNGIAL